MKHKEISEAALAELVRTFYAQVREDSLIGPIFNGAVENWDEHLDRLQAFWSSVMLTSGRYKGQPLRVHIEQGEGITQTAFERWLSLWRQTTERLFEPALASALQDKAARIAESLSLGIAFHRDSCAGLLAPTG